MHLFPCSFRSFLQLLCSLFVGVTYVIAEDLSTDAQRLILDNNRFALAFYRGLSSDAGNLFISPYSVSSALTMTFGGARGATAEEMRRVLHLNLEAERLHAAFSDIGSHLHKIGDRGPLELQSVQSLWPHKDYQFLPEYFDLLRKYYGVSIVPLDYATATEAARATINAWVAEQTSSRVKDLIGPGALSDLTRLVLVNAIYFKGSWAKKFDAKLTSETNFHITKGTTARVPMMKQRGTYRFAEVEGARVLELPYVGEELAMFVVLPEELDGMEKVEGQLTYDTLHRWIQQLVPQQVAVELPKFRISWGAQDLTALLKSLGMTSAFSSKADFSGMDGTQRLYIDAVLHKSFVAVSEEGTEAAAATAVIMRLKGMQREIPLFKADHPFIFLIRDVKTGMILFMGRVVDPSPEAT